MAKRKRKPKKPRRRRPGRGRAKATTTASLPRSERGSRSIGELQSASLHDLEVHRGGFGLVTRSARGRAHRTIWVGALDPRSRGFRSCSCRAQGTCSHLRELGSAIRGFGDSLGGRDWETVFGESSWAKLLRLLHEERPVDRVALGVETVEREGAPARRFLSRGDLLADYLDQSSGEQLEARLGLLEELPDAAGILDRLALAQLTPIETELRARGARTERCAWEEGFWGRLAYHCLRTFGDETCVFRPRLAGPGDLRILCRASERPAVEVAVPAEQSVAVLLLLAEGGIGDGGDPALHPTPFDPVLVMEPSGGSREACRLRSAVRVRLSDDENRLFPSQEIRATQAGNLVYVPELAIFGRLANVDPVDGLEDGLELSGDEVPAFLQARRAELHAGQLVLSQELCGLRILGRHDSVSVRLRPAERGWYWVAARYRFGARSVELAELLRERREGRRYLRADGGWVDLESPSFRTLDLLLQRQQQLQAGVGDETERERGSGELRLRSEDLLRLQVTGDGPWRFATEDGGEILARLLALRPSRSLEQQSVLRSPLRDYQRRGVEWLLFLYENGLGGLLCDEMGLGKTHQALALMATLVELVGVAAPMLVISPTSVISHWRNKIREQAPGLRAVVHHGRDRQPLESLKPADVVLTSYGVLRRDREELSRRSFAVLVFDEIQALKNRHTRSHRAAAELRADLRLGLTGTPIENSLDELRALVDLVLPGYLSGSLPRRRSAVAAGGVEPDPEDVVQLRRILSPVVLRRLKDAVLHELPEKIEDLRTCELSDHQAEQYRTALARRGDALLGALEREAGPLPYLHVFAVLNLLKQICDHPALALGEPDRYREYRSGKWELFVELLEESLDSGQKVVVFTQYLGMIEIMKRHLESSGTDHVTLTGASRNRGEIVDRFNRDPACRVFLGSLKAGGTGIDLVGGSVVIHYDRWWNAAREDQATDRVHRIGQRRAVHVLKLLTEGTLEERIAAIVERKRRLLSGVVVADDPTLSKLFTREELIELLQPAGD